MSLKLRDLILKVRDRKTAGEERATISKECALIRTSFKDSNLAISDYYRPRNLLKLLFIHLRAVNNNSNYPPVAHYGQMESIKLIAKNIFYQKRVGYLSLSILMGSDASLMMLVTNSVSLDLQKPSNKGMFSNEKFNEPELCAILALNCIANVTSKEMVLNLAPAIYRSLKSKRSFIKNKTLVCIDKIVSYDNDLIPDYFDIVLSMFKEYHLSPEKSSIVRNIIKIFITILKQDVEDKIVMRLADEVLTPVLELLTRLVNNSFGGSNQGVYEPFLQVKMLEFIVELNKRVSIVSKVDTTLLLLLTNVPEAKGMGYAVKYECLKTIFSLVSAKTDLSRSEIKLETAAVNMLLDFLSQKESKKDGVESNKLLISLRNINKLLQHSHKRYLSIFSDYEAKFTSFLDHSDTSLVKASLNLLFTILNEKNCEVVGNKLVNYAIKTTNNVHKEFVNENLLRFFKFRTKQNNLLETKVNLTLRMICFCDKQVTYETYKFFVNIVLCVSEKVRSEILLFLSCFTYKTIFSGAINEQNCLIKSYLMLISLKIEEIKTLFGQTFKEINQKLQLQNKNLPKIQFNFSKNIFSAKELVKLIHRVLVSADSDVTMKSLSLTSLTSIAFIEKSEKNVILNILSEYCSYSETEIKTRAKEYYILLKEERIKAFEKLPKPDLEAFAIEIIKTVGEEKVYGRLEVQNEADDDDDLLNINDLAFEEDGEVNKNKTRDGDDLLGDILATEQTKPEEKIKLEAKSIDFDPFASLADAMK